jgi:NADPH-dependent 2,4-dienoyl-CoA reductase/sulfur reductase-like enzyme/pSer/pThr/pTyr-binding forkhead associated (FHA) protein
LPARKRYLIIGDGAAGLTAAQRLRRQDPLATIGIFTDDPQPGYFRAALTNYLLGELREDQIWAVTPDFYESFSVHRIFSRVTAVDTARSELWCSTSTSPTPYDRLLIASGARARSPSFPGAHLPGVMTLRTIQDARQVVDFLRLRGLKNAVVLGGGALGLEWAHALLEHGVTVTILERSPRFLPSALDQLASDLLATRLRQAGIQVLLGEELAAAQPGHDGSVGAIVTASGRMIPCELLAVALGISPNSAFLQSSGIQLTQGGAIAVDRSMATSVPNVWAAGDVANVEGEQLGLWEPARLQGRIAADNMLGRRSSYEPGAHYFATRLFDLDFARVGSLTAAQAGEELVDFPRGTGKIAYRRLVLDSGRLVGALMIGERSARVRATGRALKRLIDAKTDVRSVKDRLLDPSFDFAAWLGTQKLAEKPAQPRPATAVIASAKLRGTQALALRRESPSSTADRPEGPASSAGARRPPEAPSAPGQGPRGTRMLSIGLVAEAPPPRTSLLGAVDARLEGLGQVFQLTLSVTNIGRDPASTIVLQDPAVCSLHAQIVRYGEALYLRDAGSRSGTWLNGRALSGAHQLADGDRLRIGAAELVFRSESLRREAPERSLLIGHAPRLEVRSGPSSGLTFALPEQPILIGSAPHCAVCLNDPTLAPEHARLFAAGAGAHALSDLGGPSGTFLRGARLPPGGQVVLADGEWLRLGSVDLLYTRAPTPDAASALRPRARLHVDSGVEAGKNLTFNERALVGSDPNASLCLRGLLPAHLELAVHAGRFWARDLSGGHTFRAGAPLGGEFVELEHGALLLLAGSTLLRFEEVV